jgi:hypothetical protein
MVNTPLGDVQLGSSLSYQVIICNNMQCQNKL